MPTCISTAMGGLTRTWLACNICMLQLWYEREWFISHL